MLQGAKGLIDFYWSPLLFPKKAGQHEMQIKSSKCKAMIENSREGETQITIQKDEAKKQ